MKTRAEPVPTPHLRRFIRALHVRLVLLRGAERAGAGMLLGCGAAAVLAPIFWWQGREPLPIAVMLLGLGVTSGILVGIVRRPTAMDAAAEADRQLRLADLVGTGLALHREGSDDPWYWTVLALADSRCRELRPSSVLLNRWGARAWGSTGLAAALVLTACLLSARPGHSLAGVSQTDRWDGEAVSPFTQPAAAAADASAAYSPTRQPIVRPLPSDNANPSDESVTGQRTRPSVRSRENPANPADRAPRQSAPGDPDHAGTGSAATDVGHSVLPPMGASASESASGRAGRSASGGQTDTMAATSASGESTLSGNSTTPTATQPASPSSASTWPRDGERALQQAESNPSYSTYRDLIQAYFDRR